jgi:protein-tyrosine phosphatase
MSEPIRVIFVCLGNICRSPLAKGVFMAKAAQRGLSDRIEVDSAGTSAYHVGEPPDPGSLRVARRVGIDLSRDRARQVTRRDLGRFDYIIALDRSNRRNLERVGADPDKVHLLRDFEPNAHSPDVPDPWGGGLDGFEDVYAIVDRATEGLLDHIVGEHYLG